MTEHGTERHVLRRDAGDWLLAWAAAGWAPATAPSIVGRTRDEEPVLLMTLVPLGEHTADPLVPELPSWTQDVPAHRA